MIQLLAVAPDGWAIVLAEGQHWLVRPPYRQSERFRSSSVQVERMLVDEDFDLEPEPRNFHGWGDLCRHVEEQRVKAAGQEERDDARDASLRLLALATGPQARRHLEKLQARLKDAHPERVEAALIALLGAPAVQVEPALVAKVSELLVRVRAARPSLRGGANQQALWPVPEETWVDQESRAVRNQGALLCPAA